MKYENYVHHNRHVWVRSDLKGTHREHCLCYECSLFFPDDVEHNCVVAQSIYSLNCTAGVTTPVYECEQFVPVKKRRDKKGS